MNDNSNVASIGAGHWPVAQRVVEPATVEQFCHALEAAEWIAKHHVNGMTILHYPRIVMICCDNGNCTIIRQAGTDIDAYFDECLKALEKVA